MKESMLLLLFACLLSGGTHAQTHLKGQRFVEIQGGVVDGLSARNPVGFVGLLSTGRYNRQYNAWKLTVSYLQKPIIGTDITSAGQLQQFSIGWGYEFNLWRNAYRTRFVRGSVQPLATYETLPAPSIHMMTDSVCTTTASGSRFLLGAEAGIEIELTPVVLSIRQRWLPKSGMQPFFTLVGVGWRWHSK